MSQQEMFPEEQHSLEDTHKDEKPAQPYYWSTRPNTSSASNTSNTSNTSNMPKDEPVSSYDEPMSESDYEHGYQPHQSQSETMYTAQQQQIPVNNAGQHYQQSSYSSGGDAFEQQYRPYGPGQQQWNVPPWARRQRRGNRWFPVLAIFILCAIFIKPLLAVVGVLFGIIAILPFVLLAILFFSLVGGRARRRRRYWRMNGPRWW